MVNWYAVAFFPMITAVACGGSDPGSLGGGSAHDRPGTTSTGAGADAGPDAKPDYRDPKAGDGGCASPNLVCNGSCVAVSSDHDNCGKCGSACIGDDSVCIASSCACTGVLRDYCDGVGCMDVSSDVANCGSCGNACDPNQFNACVQGNCVLDEN
jgi:hypothetical protein